MTMGMVRFLGNFIKVVFPEEQKDIAEETRRVVRRRIGLFTSTNLLFVTLNLLMKR